MNASRTSIRNLPLLKHGSVKNLRRLDDRRLVFEFTDDFSVFDWGKMPDSIPEKGRSLLELAIHLFRELSHPASWRAFFASEFAPTDDALPARLATLAPTLRRELESIGLRSCYREAFGGAGLVVEELSGVPPKKSPNGFDYSGAIDAAGNLIPLEVVFRHALTEKSSYFDRNPGTTLRPGDTFPVPMIEFFTKLEPTDRFLETREEALRVGRISEPRLAELELRTMYLSLWLKRECSLRSLELVDGKFEWGFDREGRILLADAIGPDELRLIERAGPAAGERLSKEFLRESFRDTKWFAEIQKLKKTGRQGEGWQKFVSEPPPMLPREALERATSLYRKLEARFRPEKVLLFGSGGREHEIARRLLDSPNLRALHWAPGQDAGFEQLRAIVAKTANGARKNLVRWDGMGWPGTDLPPAEREERIKKLIVKARDAGITLVVISQDADLAAGAGDSFREAGFPVFGPSREAARVEWSKAFSKEICVAAGVPTARAHVAGSRTEAEKILAEVEWTESTKWVVKADGLALGKGVVVAETREEAIASLDSLSKYGERFLIEERIRGDECSWFAFSDGESFSLLDPAKDYKRLRDGQTGPNTGGMGSISPAPGTTPELRERVRSEVFAPVFAEFRRRGIRYQGLLYAGLMIDATITGNRPRLNVLEFNARFGDPETQALLPRLATDASGDLLLWMSACARGTLRDLPRDVPFQETTSVYVVAASAGYPESPRTGTMIPLSAETLADEGLRFAGLKQMGTTWNVSGGRVLGAVGMGANARAAREEAYRRLEPVLFEGAQVRKDIGES